MSFIDTFNLLRNNYEQKEKPENETSTYNLLRLLISQYGYDSVCDEISFNKGRNECKNKELSTIMTEIKKKVSVEVLCSQLFYLDDSLIFSQKNSINDKQIKDKNINSIKTINNGKNNNPFKFKVLKSQKMDIE